MRKSFKLPPQSPSALAELEELPKTVDKISRSEFDVAIKRLKLNKATGPDGIPAEAYKFCPKVQDELFKIISYMWDNEVVPANLVSANFRMLFKHKGSKEDPSRYRCIALLNHAYKVLSIILILAPG